MREFDLAETESERGIRTLNVPEYPLIHERVWNAVKSAPQKIYATAKSVVRDAGLTIRDGVQGIASWARDRSCKKLDCKEIYKYAGYSAVGNALDHAIVSTVMAHEVHPLVARAMGEVKEVLGSLGNRYNGTDNENQKDSEIDRCNNMIGTQIGKFARENALGGRDITTLMVDALRQGQFALGDDARLKPWNNGNCKPWDGPSMDWIKHDMPPYVPRSAPKTAQGK